MHLNSGYIFTLSIYATIFVICVKYAAYSAVVGTLFFYPGTRLSITHLI